MTNIAILSTAHIHTKSFIENLVKATDGRKAYAIWDDVADRGHIAMHSPAGPITPATSMSFSPTQPWTDSSSAPRTPGTCRSSRRPCRQANRYSAKNLS